MTLVDEVVKARGQRTRRARTARDKQKARWGWIFISPWLIGFFLFWLLPMGASLFFSGLDFQLATPEDARWIGLANWSEALFNDPEVWRSMWITFRFALINLPIGLTVAFFLAVLLNSQHLIGKNLFRTLFYLPSVVPFIAAVLIWNQVLNSQTGWVNRMISLFGVSATGVGGLEWLNNPTLIPFTYTFIGIWGVGNMILINLAGLQGIPTHLYEAAQIDGAGWWRRLRSITLPMLSPVIFYNVVLGMVGLLQYFLPPFVLQGTSGAPEGSSLWYMVYFYRRAFGFAEMGYGATLAWLLFLVALAATLIIFGTAKYWVFYSAEDAA